MKRTVFLFVCFVTLVTSGFAQGKPRGEKGISSVGGIVGYVIERQSSVIGIDYRYNILDRVRLAPSALYLFEKYHEERLYLNADVHYLARITREVTLYPIGGIGAALWRYKVVGLLEGADEWRLGVNLGFGGEIRMTKDIIVGTEFRYNWTKRYFNEAVIMGRVAYYF